MRFSRPTAIFVTLAAWACGCAGQSSELPKELLDLVAIKQRMLRSLTKLPDYTCLETLERSRRMRDNAPFKLVDKVRMEVLYSGSREFHAWPGSRTFNEKDAPRMLSGVSSNGEFASHAKSVFVNNAAEISYAGVELFRGRRALKYNYRLPLLFSGWTVTMFGQTGTMGARGAFWADAETFELLHLDVNAEDIPPNIAIAGISVGIDYGRIRLESSEVSMPQTAELLLAEIGGVASRNLMAFTQCRGYRAESVLSFGDAPAGEVVYKTALQDAALPGNLVLDLRLESAIDSRKSIPGDPLTATVRVDAKFDGVVIVPKGAVVHGRIRRMEAFDHPGEHLIVALEFFEIEFAGKRAEFLGSLQRMDELPGLSSSLASTTTHVEQLNGGIRTTTSTWLDSAGPELPGVSTFRIEGSRALLPTGFKMSWQTMTLQQ